MSVYLTVGPAFYVLLDLIVDLSACYFLLIEVSNPTASDVYFLDRSHRSFSCNYVWCHISRLLLPQIAELLDAHWRIGLTTLVS